MLMQLAPPRSSSHRSMWLALLVRVQSECHPGEGECLQRASACLWVQPVALSLWGTVGRTCFQVLVRAWEGWLERCLCGGCVGSSA